MRLIKEMHRRRVFKIALAYLLVGWALIEAAATLFDMFNVPVWMAQVFAIVIVLGFPVAIILAWAIQVTPDGIVVDAGSSTTARKMRDEKIRFVTAPDGVKLAYALTGNGPPLVKTAHWLTHLEKDRTSPLWHHWLASLGAGRTLLRYDERGCGLSDRNVNDISLDAFVMDLETVVDAAGLERFPIFGASQGGPVSIDYTVRHPERVSALILYGSFARGWTDRKDPDIIEKEQAMIDLVRVGWGQDNAAFRQMYATLFVPDANPEQAQSFNDMARDSASPETAAEILTQIGGIDVRDMLPLVSVPTLIIHVRRDARIHVANGRELAAHIPNAEFVVIEGRNHIILEHEPAFAEFSAVVNEFLERHPG